MECADEGERTLKVCCCVVSGERGEASESWSGIIDIFLETSFSGLLFFRSPFTQYMAFNQSHDVVWWNPWEEELTQKKDRVNKREEQRKGFGWVGIGAKQPSSTSSWELRSFLMMILKGKEIRCVHGNESIYPMFLRVFYEKKDKSFMLNEYRINYLENNFLSSPSKQFSFSVLDDYHVHRRTFLFSAAFCSSQMPESENLFIFLITQPTSADDVFILDLSSSSSAFSSSSTRERLFITKQQQRKEGAQEWEMSLLCRAKRKQQEKKLSCDNKLSRVTQKEGERKKRVNQINN